MVEKDRDIVKASLTPEAKEAFDRAVNWLGMKHQVALGRLIKWFTSQDALSQCLVMGLVPEADIPDVASIIARRSMPDPKPPGSVEEAQAVGKTLSVIEFQRASIERERKNAEKKKDKPIRGRKKVAGHAEPSG